MVDGSVLHVRPASVHSSDARARWAWRSMEPPCTRPDDRWSPGAPTQRVAPRSSGAAGHAGENGVPFDGSMEGVDDGVGADVAAVSDGVGPWAHPRGRLCQPASPSSWQPGRQAWTDETHPAEPRTRPPSPRRSPP